MLSLLLFVLRIRCASKRKLIAINILYVKKHYTYVHNINMYIQCEETLDSLYVCVKIYLIDCVLIYMTATTLRQMPALFLVRRGKL